MKYLTLEYIKAHSRIDCDCEDDLIDAYGSAAEDTIIGLLNRSLEDLKATNGGVVPNPVIVATLQLTENLIQHRSNIEQVGLSTVPYSFDMMIKPYMIL